MRYPNGKKYEANKEEVSNKKEHRTLLSAANRGMSLEEDINLSNEYYRDNQIALIHKRPTPINIVKVDYSKGARITDAYFEKQSTTDYNGVYKGTRRCVGGNQPGRVPYRPEYLRRCGPQGGRHPCDYAGSDRFRCRGGRPRAA